MPHRSHGREPVGTWPLDRDRSVRTQGQDLPRGHVRERQCVAGPSGEHANDVPVAILELARHRRADGRPNVDAQVEVLARQPGGEHDVGRRGGRGPREGADEEDCRGGDGDCPELPAHAETSLGRSHAGRSRQWLGAVPAAGVWTARHRLPLRPIVPVASPLTSAIRRQRRSMVRTGNIRAPGDHRTAGWVSPRRSRRCAPPSS